MQRATGILLANRCTTPAHTHTDSERVLQLQVVGALGEGAGVDDGIGNGRAKAAGKEV